MTIIEIILGSCLIITIALLIFMMINHKKEKSSGILNVIVYQDGTENYYIEMSPDVPPELIKQKSKLTFTVNVKHIN